MERNQANVLQVTLDLFILKAIGDDEFHGLGIARRVEQITQGAFKVRPGSLLPALHRMEEAGSLSSSLGESQRTTGAQSITGAQKPANARWGLKPNSGRQFPAPSDSR